MPETTPRRDPETDDLAGLISDLGKAAFAFVIFPATWLVLAMGGAELLRGWF